MVNNPPTDGITDIAFSPVADYFAASSWDNQTRIWEYQAGTGNTVPKAAIQHEGPVMACAWSKDGTKLVSAGADKAGRMMDLNTGQTTQIAAHDNVIKCVKFVDNVGGQTMVVTGSWDKTMKYWDLRQSNPAFTMPLPERCYTMDVVNALMVVGTAERHVMIYNLNNPSVVFKQIISPLKWQTRVISCFPNGSGFAIGSIEGRVGIQYVEDKDQQSNFSFKCQRDEKNLNIYSVNCISFHPVYGTFSTSGSDGVICFWDKDSRSRLKLFPSVGHPISSSAFSRNGSIFAYAASYDWSKGHEHHKQGSQNQIFLHAVKDEDIKNKPLKARR